jgi:hypothetical protein
MTTAIAKTLLDTLELRAGSVITQTEIAALKKRWRPHGWLARTDPDIMADEQRDLYDALPMFVCDEQAKRGLDYLRNLLLKKDGTLRQSKLVEGFGVTDDGHGQVVRTLDHFLFTGFHEDRNAFGCVVSLYPIYRAVAHNGPWFEYVARPWVGGLPSFGELFEVLS